MLESIPESAMGDEFDAADLAMQYIKPFSSDAYSENFEHQSSSLIEPDNKSHLMATFY